MCAATGDEHNKPHGGKDSRDRGHRCYCTANDFRRILFLADRKGRLVHQSIKPDAEKNYGFIEERVVLREQPELFTRLVERLRAVDFLTYREGRELGIPDELRLQIELTLSNGSKITASKWAHDRVKALDELLDRMRAIIDAARKIQKPVRLPYDDKEFGAHAHILKAA